MSDTSIETFGTQWTQRRIFWRKIYTFSAISLLSAFVICWTHFGHHFGVNDDNLVDIIENNRFDFISNISDESIESLNESLNEALNDNSSDNGQDHLETVQVVSDSLSPDTLVEEPINQKKPGFEDMWTSVNDKLSQITNDQAHVKDNISKLESHQDKIELQLRELNEKTALIDDDLLDIRDEIILIKDTLKLILNQLNSSEINKKEKRRKQNN